jgi:hypothetical protein
MTVQERLVAIRAAAKAQRRQQLGWVNAKPTAAKFTDFNDHADRAYPFDKWSDFKDHYDKGK